MKEEGLAYRASHQSIKVVETYKKMYTGFDNRFIIVDRFSYARWLIEQIELKKYLNQNIDNFKNKSCLDFACGTGRLTQFIEPFFKQTVGIDISDEMIQVAKDQNINASFHILDITKNDFLEYENFDIIFAFRFFLRAENSLRKDVMNALRKQIKKGGIFIFNVHDSPKSLNYPLYLYAKLAKRESPVHSNFDLGIRRSFEPIEVERMLKDCGFEIVKIAKIGFIPNYLYGLPYLYNIFYKLDTFMYKYKLLQGFSIERVYYCRAI